MGEPGLYTLPGLQLECRVHTGPRSALEVDILLTDAELVALMLDQSGTINNIELRIGLAPIIAMLDIIQGSHSAGAEPALCDRTSDFVAWLQQSEPEFLHETASYAKQWASGLCVAHHQEQVSRPST